MLSKYTEFETGPSQIESDGEDFLHKCWVLVIGQEASPGTEADTKVRERWVKLKKISYTNTEWEQMVQ